jgi:hypothetical protein
MAQAEGVKMTDPLEEALFQVQYWTAQANQLTIANNEKADEIRQLEQEVKHLKTLLGAASVACYTTGTTWQDGVKNSLAHTFMQAHATLDALEQKQAGEIIERIEKEKA